ncbi:MAG: hypothetical protein PHV59_06850 [Victivallales bacterium]|nr:hypothetical protein [Victivallales bacterium]
MLRVIKNKLKEVRDESYVAMLNNTYEACIAAGRYACACLLLDGGIPEDAECGIEIFPPDWPQRKGWQEVIKQFKGLI